MSHALPRGFLAPARYNPSMIKFMSDEVRTARNGGKPVPDVRVHAEPEAEEDWFLRHLAQPRGQERHAYLMWRFANPGLRSVVGFGP